MHDALFIRLVPLSLALLFALAPCRGLDVSEIAAPQVWLAGVDPFVRHAMKAETSDFQDLFSHDAQWKTAEKHTAVFKTSTQWILNGPTEDLAQMFRALKERGIALAVEALILTREEDGCGRIEGYSPPYTMRKAAQRIKSLGGTLGIVAFDEPLWFGHAYAGANACRSSIEEIARVVATNVRQIREVFPDVKVGDIEPIEGGQRSDWTETILRWTDALNEAHEPLTFMHLDLDWHSNFEQKLSDLAQGLRRRNIRIGIIYNGDQDESDDSAWVKKAESRFELVESRLGFLPDDAILQTWMVHPTKMLPEDFAGSMTYLIDRYARVRTNLTVKSTKLGIHVELMDQKDAPIGGAAIRFVKSEDGRTGKLTIRDETGLIPANATSAVIAVRLNTECNCSGFGDLGVGPLKYTDNAGNTFRVSMDPHISTTGNSADAQGAIAQFNVSPATSVKANSLPFPVVAGRRYHLDIPLRASVDVQHAGYLALIFLGKDNAEIARHRIDLLPGKGVLATLVTRKDGAIDLNSAPDIVSEINYITFAGDDKFRGVSFRTH